MGNTRLVICAWVTLMIISAIQGAAQSGSQHYFCVDYHQHVWHFNGAVGSWEDISTATNAPAASSASRLGGFGDSIGEHVFVEMPNQHVYQLYYTSGSWLGAEDLTAGTGNTLAAAGTSLTAFSDSPGEHLAYLGTNQHIYQLFYSFATRTWGNGDLTAITGNVPAASGSSLTSFSDSLGEHIFFVGTNQHVYQLYYSFNTRSWLGVEDLTAGTGNTLAASGSSLTSFSDSLGEHAAYEGTNQHIYQLFYSFGTRTWGNEDLTVTTGAPIASPGSGLTSFWDPAGTYIGPGGEHVFYESGGAAYLLLYKSSSWSYRNISYATNGYPGLSPLASLRGVESNPPDEEELVFWSSTGLGFLLYLPSPNSWIFQSLFAYGTPPSPETASPLLAFIDP